MFEIENYKMPCYFIGLEHLPFRYENQKKILMSSLKVCILRKEDC